MDEGKELVPAAPAGDVTPALLEGAEMSEERLQILRMVQEGKVTVEEGARLIDALSAPQATLVSREGRRGKTLRIRVEDADGSKVHINVPVALASLAAKFVPKGVLTVEGEEISLDEIIQVVREGTEGKILEIEKADGSRVEVAVE
ncbi:MAG: SHOCT-like domain-containing protein [Armatimonadota bacterium]